MRPAVFDLDAQRWTPFLETFRFLGQDFTGTVCDMHVRLYPDAPGAPLIDLDMAVTGQGLKWTYSGTDTVANHVSANRLPAVPDGMQSTDSLALSLLQILINESTIEALPQPDELGGDSVLAWDIHMTEPGKIKQKYIGGAFTVKPGATQ